MKFFIASTLLFLATKSLASDYSSRSAASNDNQPLRPEIHQNAIAIGFTLGAILQVVSHYYH